MSSNIPTILIHGVHKFFFKDTNVEQIKLNCSEEGFSKLAVFSYYDTIKPILEIHAIETSFLDEETIQKYKELMELKDMIVNAAKKMNSRAGKMFPELQ